MLPISNRLSMSAAMCTDKWDLQVAFGWQSSKFGCKLPQSVPEA